MIATSVAVATMKLIYGMSGYMVDSDVGTDDFSLTPGGFEYVWVCIHAITHVSGHGLKSSF